MMHRDSLGMVQRIEPGAINWMTAGRGIVHSERTPEDLRGIGHVTHGLQLWCALPAAAEDCAPSFVHTPAAAIPEAHGPDFAARVMVGELFGVTSPVGALSPTLYAEIRAEPGHVLTLPASRFERGVYVLGAAIAIDGAAVVPFTLAVLAPGAARIAAPQGAHYVIVGGEPLGHRHMVWNFVSSSRERIEAAKAAWRAQTMGQVPGEHEFIELP